MLTRQFNWSAVILVALSASVVAQEVDQAEASKLFEELFGQEVRSVKKTPDRTDDVELGQRLLKSLESVKSQPALIAIICQQAYSLCMRHPSGTESAMLAMRTLALRIPDKAESSLDRLIALQRRKYMTSKSKTRASAAGDLIRELESAGDLLVKHEKIDKALVYYRQAVSLSVPAGNSPDRLKSKIGAIEYKRKTKSRLASLYEEIKANPKDVQAASELAMFHIVQRNDPVEARGLSKVLDKKTRQMIILAVQDPRDLSQDECMQLGAWYQAQADQASGPAQAAMLQRVMTYYRQFIERNKSKDLRQVKAQLKLDSATKRLAKFVDKGPLARTLNSRARYEGTVPTFALTPAKLVTVKIAQGGDPLFAAALFESIGRNDLTRVKDLVDGGGGVNTPRNRDSSQRTPLLEALRNPDKKMIEFLLSEGADPSHTDRSRQTPLSMAVRSYDPDMIALLLRYGAKTNFPLHLASMAKDVEWARYLLDQGADVNELRDQGYSPLYDALTEARVDSRTKPPYTIDQLNQRGETIARMLIAKGANVDSLVSNRLNLLQSFASNGHGRQVGFLRMHGATSDIPLHDAVGLSDLESMAKLLADGADPNEKNINRMTPLHQAFRRYANTAVVTLLLEKGADPNIRMPGGEAVLYRAVRSIAHNMEVVAVLVKYNADVKARGYRGTTALHEIVRYRGRDIDKVLPIIQAMIDKGADPNAKDDRRNTPLGNAKRNGNAQILAILQGKSN